MYASQNNNRVIWSRRMRLVGHVACMGTYVYTELWSKKPEDKIDHLEDIGIGGGNVKSKECLKN
jgi:hypothetical protein